MEKIGTAVEPLICTLKARPPGPKNSVAAMVLGKIGDARAVEPLIEAIGSGHVDVAANAMRALGKIGDARAVGPLIDILINGSGSSYYEREFLSQAKEAPPALALLAYQRLRGESYWVRQKAARALGDIGDKRAIDPLKTALNDEALEHTVVKEALEKIRGRRENGDIW